MCDLAVVRCRLGPEREQLDTELGQHDTAVMRQIGQRAGMSTAELAGMTHDVLLCKMACMLMYSLSQMGLADHMPSDSEERLRWVFVYLVCVEACVCFMLLCGMHCGPWASTACCALSGVLCPEWHAVP